MKWLAIGDRDGRPEFSCRPGCGAVIRQDTEPTAGQSYRESINVGESGYASRDSDNRSFHNGIRNSAEDKALKFQVSAKRNQSKMRVLRRERGQFLFSNNQKAFGRKQKRYKSRPTLSSSLDFVPFESSYFKYYIIQVKNTINIFKFFWNYNLQY